MICWASSLLLEDVKNKFAKAFNSFRLCSLKPFSPSALQRAYAKTRVFFSRNIQIAKKRLFVCVYACGKNQYWWLLCNILLIFLCFCIIFYTHFLYLLFIWAFLVVLFRFIFDLNTWEFLLVLFRLLIHSTVHLLTTCSSLIVIWGTCNIL